MHLKLGNHVTRRGLAAKFRARMLVLATLVLCAQAECVLAKPSDWYRWRGPDQNGISPETELVSRFDYKGGPGSNLLWKNVEAAGISTPIVMRGKLYTIVRDQPGTRNDGEKILCLDAATGQRIWENRYNVFLSDVPAERVGWANCAGDPVTGNVFALGSSSLLQCVNGESGNTIWSRSLSEEFGMLSTYGGRTNTPIVFEDLVIVSGVTTGWDETARPAHRFLAFDSRDGRLVWIRGTRPLPEDTTYSTPFVTRISGVDTFVAGSGDGSVYSIQSRTGKVIWSYQLSRRGINVSPVESAGTVFIGHSEENPVGTTMGAVVAIRGAHTDETNVAGELWKTEKLTVGRSSPLLIDGRLYVVDDSAGLHVIDAKTGSPIGRKLKLGTAMRGSLVAADGKIFACTATGVFHILKPSERGVESVFRTRLPGGEECGGSIAISHGKVYLPTTGGIYCLAAEDATSSSTETKTSADSPSSQVRTSPTDLKPAQLQLVPAEALVKPGESIRFELRVFNAAGQPLKNHPATAKFATSGSGQIDDDGTFRPEGTSHTHAVVTATLDGLSAQSRIRIVPALPWKFDFTDGDVPITWIGARYRHVGRTVDGEPVMVKITTIPKGTRSQLWMGSPALHDYTFQADLKAAESATGSKPDMGIIAQRYTLDMMGESQQLQIRTWPAQLRMAKTIPMKWESDVWYTVKLRASNEGGRAVLHGKVWKRSEPEPDSWTITADDEAPNVSGSPGLFGNATNAEIFIDNISVTSN